MSLFEYLAIASPGRGMPDREGVGPHRVVAFRPERNGTVDTLRWAKKRHLVPILVEVDVTGLREAIREHRRRSGSGLSLTAWMVSRVARAAAEHPRVHGIRRGTRRLVLFDEVDVAVVVERSLDEGVGGESLPMPVVIRGADRKNPTEITQEIRQAQRADLSPGTSSLEESVSPRLQALFFRAPAWVRDLLFWRWLVRSPWRMKRTMGTVVVTAAGMVAPGVLTWGIPLSLHPLAVSIGGIVRRKNGASESEMLGLTVVFDHEVTDGAPVGRFVHRLTELISDGAELTGPEHGEGRSAPATP